MAQTKKGALKSAAKYAGIQIEEFIAKINAGLKKCTRCKEWKSVIEFGNDRTRPDGKDSSCFPCRRVKEKKSTKGRVSTFKGRKHSTEAKLKIGMASAGRESKTKGIPRSAETKGKVSKSKRESSLTPRGENCHSYKDGMVQVRRGDRFSAQYKQWRYDVFTRDGFACTACGDSKGGNLCAHHIKSFADHTDLRFDVSNGITLCDTCHKAIHQAKV